jgi:hypothetical protein
MRCCKRSRIAQRRLFPWKMQRQRAHGCGAAGRAQAARVLCGTGSRTMPSITPITLKLARPEKAVAFELD